MLLTRLAVGLEPLNALDAAHRSPRSVVGSPVKPATRRLIKRNKDWRKSLSEKLRRQINPPDYLPFSRQKIPPSRDGARNFAGTIGRSRDASAGSHRDVVGTTQHLDRDDAGLGKSPRYLRRG